jgi:hypothetical protein
MRVSSITSAIAITAALVIPAAAQAQGLQQGWNKVEATNCLFWPGTPATATQPAAQDRVEIFVNIAQDTGPAGPPPVPDSADFFTSDPIAITLAAPFCSNGNPFYVFMQGDAPVYFSIFPHLS